MEFYHSADQSEYQRQQHPANLVLNYYVANFKDYRLRAARRLALVPNVWLS